MNSFAEGERRWTAVLFADMANFSAVTETVGSEKVYQLIARVVDIAIEAIESHGGKPLNFGGDSLLAAFGAPVALEDASLQACRAARAFLDGLEAEQDKLERRFGVRPEFRVGISGGNVVIGRMGLSDKMDLNIMGAPVNEASRLEALALPGQILISEAVAAQAEGWLETRSLGPQSLKGFAAPVTVLELQGLRETATRFDAMARRGLVEIVGRDADLTILRNRFEPLPDKLALATLGGPPGIGKSRLLHDLQKGITSSRVLLGQCNPATRNVAFKPFAEILRAASGAGTSAKGQDVIAGLKSLLGEDADVDPLEVLFRESSTLSADDADKAMEEAMSLRQSLLRTLGLICRQSPTTIVIEDAHWLDDLSSGLIDMLINTSDRSPQAGLILSHRPEYNPRWITDEKNLAINLQPLSAEETETLAERHLKGRKLSPSLVRYLASKAEGNPLFAEEILRLLTADNALVDTPEGLDLSAQAAPELVAGNLQQIVLRRVDALPENTRRLLLRLSAVGRQVPRGMLDRLAAPEEIEVLAETATKAGLLEEDPTSEQDLRFSHALLRDAIYGGLLEEQRVQIHGLVANAMEDWQASLNRDLTAQLAYHFDKAEMAEKAVQYLVKAGIANARIYAFRQMGADFRRATEFIHDDPSVIDDATYNSMVTVWLAGLNDQGDFRTLNATAEEFLPRLLASGAEAAYDRGVASHATSLAHTREYSRGLEIVYAALDRSNARGDTWTAAWCKLSLVRLLDESAGAPPAEILAYALEALDEGKQSGDVSLHMAAEYHVCAYYRGEGRVLKARYAARELQRFADENGDQRARAYAVWSQAIVLLTCDEVEQAYDLVKGGLRYAVTDSADRLVLMSIASATCVLGPEPESMKRELEEVLVESDAHRDFNLIHGSRLSEAIMNLRMRRIALGMMQLDQIVRDVASVGNVVMTRYFVLVRAEILLTIAGLLPPAQLTADAPDRSVKAPDKMRMADFLTVLKVKFTARKQARSNLDMAIDYMPTQDGAIYARALICNAALARKGPRRAEYLDQARAIAEKNELSYLIRRIDALAS